MKRAAVCGLAAAGFLTVAGQAAPADRPVVANDRRGDVVASDVDIVRVRLHRAGGRIDLRITLAANVRGDAIYGAYLNCGQSSWQIAYKRAAGADAVFQYDWGGDTGQKPAGGAIRGREVAIVVTASAVGCATGPFRFQAFAETTNGRARITDDVPEPGPRPLNPRSLRYPR